jgi:hypothetical protein
MGSGFNPVNWPLALGSQPTEPLLLGHYQNAAWFSYHPRRFPEREHCDHAHHIH